MNGKLIKLSLAGAAAVALAAGGGTYAAWSDLGTIGGNDAGAGVLKLSLTPNQPGADVAFNQVKMAPGGINSVRNVYIASNDATSTPDAQLFLSIKNLKGTEDGCDGGELADDPSCGDTSAANQGQFVRDALLQVTSYAVNSPGECNQAYAPAGKAVTPLHGGSPTWWSTQAPWQLTGDGTALSGANMSVLKPGQGLCVSMTLGLAYAVNNASQGDSASWDTEFDLVQSPYGT